MIFVTVKLHQHTRERTSKKLALKNDEYEQPKSTFVVRTIINENC